MNLNQIEDSSQSKPIVQVNPVSESNSLNAATRSSHVKYDAQNVKRNINKMSFQETTEIVESLEGYMNAIQTNISFSVDSKSEEVIVTIKNKETDEVIRQIPPEELVELQEKMKELTGMIFSERV